MFQSKFFLGLIMLAFSQQVIATKILESRIGGPENSYMFRMYSKCGNKIVEIAVTEREEIEAIRDLVEGFISPDQFRRRMLEADPFGWDGLEARRRLVQFSVLCAQKKGLDRPA